MQEGSTQRMKSNRFLAAVFMTVFTTACFTHTYTVGAGGDVTKPPTYSASKGHFLNGLISDDNVINVSNICPSGNATIKDQHTFVNLLIGALIGIIYRPTNVEVYCGEGGTTSSVVIPPETLRQIALDPRALELAKELSDEKAAELTAAIYAYSGETQLVAR
jgi:hypothetical protein